MLKSRRHNIVMIIIKLALLYVLPVHEDVVRSSSRETTKLKKLYGIKVLREIEPPVKCVRIARI